MADGLEPLLQQRGGGECDGGVLDADLQGGGVGDGVGQEDAEGVAAIPDAELGEDGGGAGGDAAGDDLARVQDFVADAFGGVGFIPGPSGEVTGAALVDVADEAGRGGIRAAGGQGGSVLEGCAAEGAHEDAVALGFAEGRVEVEREAVVAIADLQLLEHRVGLVGDATGEDAGAVGAGQDDFVRDTRGGGGKIPDPATDVVGAALVEVSLEGRCRCGCDGAGGWGLRWGRGWAAREQPALEGEHHGDLGGQTVEVLHGTVGLAGSRCPG